MPLSNSLWCIFKVQSIAAMRFNYFISCCWFFWLPENSGSLLAPCDIFREAVDDWTNQKPDGDFTFAIISDFDWRWTCRYFQRGRWATQTLRPEFIRRGRFDRRRNRRHSALKRIRLLRWTRAKSRCAIFHVAGNHDLTNPTMRRYWEKRYGKHYYHFVYQNVLFWFWIQKTTRKNAWCKSTMPASAPLNCWIAVKPKKADQSIF